MIIVFLAQTLLGDIDDKIDPCEDFYGYVCNKWMDRHPVSKKNPYITPSTKIRENLPKLLKGKENFI